MQTVLITGGTGLIGKALLDPLIKKKYRIIILSRKKRDPSEHITYALWNVKRNEIDIKAIQQADYIIHLAGAGVMDKRWTGSYKKEILSSRTESSRLLVKTLKENPHHVKAVVSASAIGWYGEDFSQHIFTENDPPDPGFLGETCRLWEAEISHARATGVRVAILRTGIVLSKKGGALPEFIRPIQWGVAAILSNGKQVISWIHIQDLCRSYIHALENDQVSGSYNAVAGQPVTNKNLMLKLAERLKGKFYIPVHVPRFIIKLMLGERSIEILKSATVSNEKIKETGFTFLYPSIDPAIDALV